MPMTVKKAETMTGWRTCFHLSGRESAVKYMSTVKLNWRGMAYEIV